MFNICVVDFLMSCLKPWYYWYEINQRENDQARGSLRLQTARRCHLKSICNISKGEHSAVGVIFIFPRAATQDRPEKSRSNQTDLAGDWWHSWEFLGSRSHGVDLLEGQQVWVTSRAARQLFPLSLSAGNVYLTLLKLRRLRYREWFETL